MESQVSLAEVRTLWSAHDRVEYIAEVIQLSSSGVLVVFAPLQSLGDYWFFLPNVRDNECLRCCWACCSRQMVCCPYWLLVIHFCCRYYDRFYHNFYEFLCVYFRCILWVPHYLHQSCLCMLIFWPLDNRHSHTPPSLLLRSRLSMRPLHSHSLPTILES